MAKRMNQAECQVVDSVSDKAPDQTLDGIVFIGNTLGPLFYHDPKDAAVLASYEAFSVLDPEEAASEWPYVSQGEARSALESMVRGLEKGIDDDLIWEYRRLFAGPGTKAAPPWGSVYTDRECVVFGEATLALRQWMRRSGIDLMGDGKEPEDHIGLMLMMLAWIESNRPELTDEFLKDHLLTWSSHFLSEMEEASTHPFYKGLARITRLSLEGIQADRGIDVAYPRYYR